MVERTVAVVQDADAVPELWVFLRNTKGELSGKMGGKEIYFWIRKQVQGLLVGGIGLLEVILHEIAVTYKRKGEKIIGIYIVRRRIPSALQTSPFSSWRERTRWKNSTA